MSCIPEALPGLSQGLYLASGRIFGEAAALIYTAGQSAPALDWSNWNIFSVPVQSRSSVKQKPWPSISGRSTVKEPFQMELDVSAGSAAVLLIFILIFNFGARKLGSYLHKKLTSA